MQAGQARMDNSSGLRLTDTLLYTTAPLIAKTGPSRKEGVALPVPAACPGTTLDLKERFSFVVAAGLVYCGREGAFPPAGWTNAVFWKTREG